MKKLIKRIFLFSLVAIVLLFLIGRRLDWFSSSKQETGNRTTAPLGLQVKGMVINPASLDNRIITSGTVIPDESVEISSEASGKITAIYFNEGKKVKKGDLLLTINDAELQAQLKRLQFQETLLVEREFRQRILLEKEAVSQEVYDKALADLNTNRAEIMMVEAQIAKTMVKAPFDGVIGLRLVSEGSYITPNMRIASLVKIQPVKIEFSIPERYATEVKLGSKINFTIGNTNKYLAEVYAVEPIIDQSTRTLKLRALYPNTNLDVIPGSFASVELILKTYYEALSIPTEALLPMLGEQIVFLYKNGIAEPVEVETGIRTSSLIQVISGISANDTIITTGLLHLKKGMAVTLSELG
ncbi:MAG: efflux RND transporter periplasmic adaptor subunit [Bacteroidales bacterium]|jgi:membrane fusion protein (multidrug efflux system)|nr:efflux RND transporter periplasmic adaptor subunit [Bacteroidales bacterium]